VTKKARAKHRRLNYLFRREPDEGPSKEIAPAAGEGYLDDVENGRAEETDESVEADRGEGDGSQS